MKILNSPLYRTHSSSVPGTVPRVNPGLQLRAINRRMMRSIPWIMSTELSGMNLTPPEACLTVSVETPGAGSNILIV
jgi:hypothetical protein